MFTYNTFVKLNDTDSAGVLFFANIFNLAHEAYERWLDSIGCSISTILNESDYILPIVHSEADYKRPMRVGDEVNIKISLESINGSGYTLNYQFVDKDGQTTAFVKTGHVVLDKESMGRTELSKQLRNALMLLDSRNI
ncbi:MAG: acyl-CoA thioesterase [Candidatus Kapabacteria bacterium]|jgi:1,4-dihydroxy-2-naphthoyl-CoA hydrolase|nr:acyl-CoA thioesterase [Candidatus Kapabacteria bacterium]